MAGKLAHNGRRNGGGEAWSVGGASHGYAMVSMSSIRRPCMPLVEAETKRARKAEERDGSLAHHVSYGHERGGDACPNIGEIT